MHRKMADKKSTVALCLPRAPHLRRFSSQAAPGKNLGDSPPRVLDSFALDWNATGWTRTDAASAEREAAIELETGRGAHLAKRRLAPRAGLEPATLRLTD